MKPLAPDAETLRRVLITPALAAVREAAYHFAVLVILTTTSPPPHFIYIVFIILYLALSDHNCHYISAILNYIGVISPFHSNYIIQLVTHSLIIHLVILRNILFILFNLMQ